MRDASPALVAGRGRDCVEGARASGSGSVLAGPLGVFNVPVFVEVNPVVVVEVVLKNGVVEKRGPALAALWLLAGVVPAALLLAAVGPMLAGVVGAAGVLDPFFLVFPLSLLLVCWSW